MADLPQVVIVEDDPEVVRVVLLALEEFGFRTEVFHDGASAQRFLRQGKPALCIVDLGLPDMDGLELVHEIARRRDCGLLILTGRGHTVDRVLGLEGGGDDYMVKPFEPRELVARVRSILRRRGAAGSTAPAPRRHALFSGWSLDCSAGVLRGPDGREQLLGTAENLVLQALLRQPNRILGREQLMEVHGLDLPARSIDVRIAKLRRRVETDPQRPRIIKTVHGVGYMLLGAVAWS